MEMNIKDIKMPLIFSHSCIIVGAQIVRLKLFELKVTKSLHDKLHILCCTRIIVWVDCTSSHFQVPGL